MGATLHYFQLGEIHLGCDYKMEPSNWDYYPIFGIIKK